MEPTDTSDTQWERVREKLKSSEDGRSNWWDESEVRNAVERAKEKGVEPGLVLACREACKRRREFTLKLGAMIDGDRRILLVDDDVPLLEMLKTNLEATGRYTVHAESDPTKAIDAALDFRPDIILMDIVMPEKDGLSLACEMLNDDSLRHIPIIMVTALADELESRAVTRDGILYLSKPVAMKELLYCIDKHLHIDSNSSP